MASQDFHDASLTFVQAMIAAANWRQAITADAPVRRARAVLADARAACDALEAAIAIEEPLQAQREAAGAVEKAANVEKRKAAAAAEEAKLKLGQGVRSPGVKGGDAGGKG